jgi:hypothetical protein
MPKSKAESHKEAIMAAVEEETESEAIAAAARAAAEIYVEQRVVPAQDLSELVEKALDDSGGPFRLKFDDGSNLYLSTSGGTLTATVSK